MAATEHVACPRAVLCAELGVRITDHEDSERRVLAIRRFFPTNPDVAASRQWMKGCPVLLLFDCFLAHVRVREFIAYMFHYRRFRPRPNRLYSDAPLLRSHRRRFVFFKSGAPHQSEAPFSEFTVCQSSYF